VIDYFKKRAALDEDYAKKLAAISKVRLSWGKRQRSNWLREKWMTREERKREMLCE
jgi:hypothetical protein